MVYLLIMVKKYIPYFVLQVLSNVLWVFWALPALNETGTVLETVEWFGVQILCPIFLSLLISKKRPFAYVLTILYGLIIGLYAVGMVGWALMGIGIPSSVYVVCSLFLIVTFGVVFHGLIDLKIGQKARRYDEIKD